MGLLTIMGKHTDIAHFLYKEKQFFWGDFGGKSDYEGDVFDRFLQVKTEIKTIK